MNTPKGSTLCGEHHLPVTAGCLTCERLVCPLCLRNHPLEEFLCPDCGERGVLPLDEEEGEPSPPGRLDEL